MEYVWVIWENNDAWVPVGGEIDQNVSGEVDGKELTMIELLHRHVGPSPGRLIDTTSPP
ncbi:hypothetical protein TA3x_003492 [Tundrisphaera sp. TA3]|uniref:hypothetical protein n=1 Tax=Tundrisphaera sp. TA3 TaxID=3435775 RepID=UPI003EC0C703